MAADMTVLRAVGVESEAELPFASLHQVLAPGLGRLDRLPEPQARALRSAFGLSAERVDDRFLISLGALGLLADLAEERPVLVLVDDAQWLDRPSAEALGFVARRLGAEPVAMLIAAREGEARRFEGAGLPERRLGGLARDDARALLRERASERLAPHVADRLVALTGGNPLALVELPQQLGPEQLAGAAPLPEHLPLTGRLEHAFIDRARGLGDGARAVLAVAVAEDTGELSVVAAAAARLGAGPADLDEAERSGLVRIAGDRVELRHPMARSALHRGLEFALRQSAHAALAEVLAGEDDADRRAWHRAAASMAADESIAAELEGTAERAGARSGYAAAAAALERAAQLSTDEGARLRRLVGAAEAAWLAGRAPLAQSLADRAEARAGGDDDVRARILSVRAAIAVVRGRPADGHALLMQAAAATDDPERAADLLLRAAQAAVTAGDPAGVGAADERARALAPGVDRAGRAWLSGVRLAMEARFEEARAPLASASRAGDHSDDPRLLVWSSNAATWLGDHDRTLALHSRAIELARMRGAFVTLATALTRRGALLAWLGRVTDAWADGEEALRLTEEAGLENGAAQARAVVAMVAALRGDDAVCREEAARALALAAERGLLPVWETATFALAELELGRGDHEAALARLAPMAAGPADVVVSPFACYAAVPALAHAAGRAGRPEAAADAVERLERWAAATGAAWARPMALRCRALLAEGDTAIGLLEAALVAQGPVASGARARIELALGESLRRAGRRGDARAHLRAAAATMAGLGAGIWAERARDELRAAGESVGPRDPGAASSLTPQERRIAYFVSEGASNKEVASQLFLSPKTVEYHLGKVFQKLGVGSRADLVALGAEAFASAPLAAD
jgi:DNA-binding CsgD family transcriptional regulator